MMRPITGSASPGSRSPGESAAGRNPPRYEPLSRATAARSRAPASAVPISRICSCAGPAASRSSTMTRPVRASLTSSCKGGRQVLGRRGQLPNPASAKPWRASGGVMTTILFTRSAPARARRPRGHRRGAAMPGFARERRRARRSPGSARRPRCPLPVLRNCCVMLRAGWSPARPRWLPAAGPRGPRGS